MMENIPCYGAPAVHRGLLPTEYSECWPCPEGILRDISSTETRYTNPPKNKGPKPSVANPDLSLARDPWVSGCTAALPRRDAPAAARGYPAGGRAWPRGKQTRGSHPYRGNRGARGGRPFRHHRN